MSPALENRLLIDQGFVVENLIEGKFTTYALTEQGRNFVQRLRPGSNPPQLIVDLPTDMLLLEDEERKNGTNRLGVLGDRQFSTLPRWWDEPMVELFKTLLDLRRQLAQQHKVPAYMIFGNKSLEQMVERRPTSRQGFLTIEVR